MSDIDMDRVALLIEVIKGCADLGPKEANAIMGVATAELREMEAVAKEEMAAMAAEAKAKEAEKLAEAAAKAQADRDEAEAAVEAEQPRAVPRRTAPTTAEIADNNARRL